MSHRIELAQKLSLPDPAGRKIRARIFNDLQLEVDDVRVGDGFIIDRQIDRMDLELISREVFLDPIINMAGIDEPLDIPCDWLIEVGFRPGVTDNVGRTAV